MNSSLNAVRVSPNEPPRGTYDVDTVDLVPVTCRKCLHSQREVLHGSRVLICGKRVVLDGDEFHPPTTTIITPVAKRILDDGGLHNLIVQSDNHACEYFREFQKLK